jgi:hypothetical protein
MGTVHTAEVGDPRPVFPRLPILIVWIVEIRTLGFAGAMVRA